MKPHDLRQQFGGSVGGRGGAGQAVLFLCVRSAARGRFRRFRRPEDPKFYSLTPTQTALLGNRGVTAAKVKAALNYLDSLTGTVAAAAGPDD